MHCGPVERVSRADGEVGGEQGAGGEVECSSGNSGSSESTRYRKVIRWLLRGTYRYMVECKVDLQLRAEGFERNISQHSTIELDVLLLIESEQPGYFLMNYLLVLLV